MSGRLESFMRERKNDLDDHDVPNGLWDKVEEGLTMKKKPGFFRRFNLKWAAAAAVILTAGIILVTTMVEKRKSGNIAHELQVRAKELQLPTSDPDYSAAAHQITTAIVTRQAELKEKASEEPQLYKEFADDLLALDSAYKVLKTRAQQSPGREEIIKAMLQNLQLQAELLARQLNIVHEYKTKKTDKDEKDKTRTI
jgi:hypothetical protein